jgi:high affinity Mn2+ porin
MIKRNFNAIKYTMSLMLFTGNLWAQSPYTFHFQQTVISQYKPTFKAPYSGTNSLTTQAETQTSLTTTLFAGVRLWKGGELYINPEMSGGSGLSGTKGIAGFTNGETFRIGDVAPVIYLARGFFKQTFALGQATDSTENNVNQIAGQTPKKYLRFIVGKFSLADYFDANAYSHDPRSQFLNWALMNNGAWDYAANVRGYTVGYVVEYGTPSVTVRFGSSEVPTTANGPDLNTDISQNYSHFFEIEKPFNFFSKPAKLRLLGYYTKTNMGNYQEAIKRSDVDITQTRNAGRTKVGVGINVESPINDWAGYFLRFGWNDGKNETWAFTEIDQSGSLGWSFNGKIFNRPDDNFGIAYVVNGISKPHRDYLAAGGYGFIIGDGKLNYGGESIFELYYSLQINKHFWLTPDAQFVKNPAYNRDRGPVFALSLRAHAEF